MRPEDCGKAPSCGNRDVKCHVCKAYSCYRPGRSAGKGAAGEKAVLRARRAPADLRRRAGSGAPAHAKGDLIDARVLYESKSGYASTQARGRKTFTLSRASLLTIQAQARLEGRLGTLTLHFDGAPDEEIWAVIPLQVLWDLLDSQSPA